MLLLQVTGVTVPIAIGARAASTVDLRVGYLQAVDSLNPFRGEEDAAYVFYGLVYDFLFSPDQDGNWIPNLALSASCDQACMNWTYQIRQGVKWSDGTDFTADDVNFTINFNIANFFQLWAYQPYVNRIVQCSAQTKPFCGAVQSGPWQVTVYFDHPFVAGRALLIPIIQKAQWHTLSPAQAQSHYDNANPIGTGPFVADPNIFAEWTGGQPLQLHKNPSYHPVGNHTGPAHIDNLFLTQFNDESTLVTALKAGDIDLAKLTPAGYAAVSGTPDIAEQESLISTNEWNQIAFSQIDATSANKNLNPARWDVNVRRALAMATNKDYIVDTVYQGKGLRGDTLIPPIMGAYWYDPTTEPGVNLTFNVQAANDLLNRSGYTLWSGGSFGNGVRQAAHAIYFNITTNACLCANPPLVMKEVPAGTKLTFTMDVRQEFQHEQDTAAYLKAQWAQVGVQLGYSVVFETTLNSDVFGGVVDTYIWYWSGGGPDPNFLLSIVSAYTLNGWSESYWNNATYNTNYVAQLAALNVTQRQQIVREAEKIHYESAIYIIYIFPFGQWAYRTDRFSGWGNWTAHPYRQFDAFYGAHPLFLDLQPNHPPTTPAILSPLPPVTVYTNTSITFVGNSTDIDPAETVTWTWNWADGTYGVHVHDSSVSQDAVLHAWTVPGTYAVTLSVSDGSYNVSSAGFTVVVRARPSAVGWINGTVRDAQSHPLSGASVTADPGGFSNTSDVSGRYSLLVAPGTYAVTARAHLFLNATDSGIIVAANGTAYANFTLLPNKGWIAGTVESATGGLIRGADILVSAAGGRQFPSATDDAGRYNVTLEPGRYSVAVTASGYVSQSQDNKAVTTGHTTVVDFRLEPVAEVGTGLSTLVLASAAIGASVAVLAVAAILIARRRKKREGLTRIELPKK